MAIRLGPFEVSELLARGGMGEVWRGVHRAEGVSVAVKVVTSQAAREEKFFEQLAREVQAVARLSHPRIVTVFDYGTVPPEAARASGGALVAGSPFIVMEYASHGSLEGHDGSFRWRTLRNLLLSLLDALAHAHARGVIHRDLKPGNILLAGELERAGEMPIKLTDFGIAHATDRDAPTRKQTAGVSEDPIGTPYYMAPEQIHGRWRLYGPWTDLYALGILAWQLACGRLPFVADDLIRLFWMHLDERIPPLEPRFPVPEGFEAWIAQLTQKAWRDRFSCAADAAWALACLPDVAIDGGEQARSGGGESAADLPFLATLPSSPVLPKPARTLAGVPTPPAHEPSLAVVDAGATKKPVLQVVAEEEVAPVFAPAVDVPPQPEEWQSPADSLPSTLLASAGLGLYSLRTIPLVDRTSERDALWAALRRVRATGRPAVLVVRGPSGQGKSRLAQWLVERAHEVGAAQALTTRFAPVPGPMHGLPRLVASHFRCVGMRAEGVLDQIEENLRAQGVTQAYEWRALAGIVVGDPSASSLPDARKPSLVGTTPEERNVLLTRMIARAARERPAIVWLDDVQWGAEGLALVEHAMTAADAPPVVFVLTARDEALEEQTAVRERLSALASRDDAIVVRVGPLEDRDTSELIERLLGLRGDLARRVLERVDGNPLFAVQLVGDWVQRGVLQPTPEGFVLRANERGDLPDDLHQVWMQRIARVLRARPADLIASFELAALLGVEVDASELFDASRELGREFPADLIEPLILSRLIVPAESGWSFAHGMLRESLERSAREAGREPELHRACARMLAAREGRGIAERRAHHLLAAGDVAEAIDPLLVAARERLDRSEFADALGLLEKRDRALDETGAPVDDARRIEGAVVRANVHRLGWDFDAAERFAQLALELATSIGLHRERAEALTVLAHVARQRGDLALAMSRNRQAFGLFDRVRDEPGLARSLLAMAIVARQQNDVEHAIEMYGRARASFEALGDIGGAASCVLGLGHVARQRQQLDEARACYALAREMFDRVGNQVSLGHAVNGHADIARYQGDLEAAERGYREAREIMLATGAKAAFIPQANLGIALVLRGDFAGAREELEDVLHTLERSGQRGYIALVHVNLLPCLAHENDLDGWDRHHEAALAMIKASSIVDNDIARPAELAGDVQSARGDRERARQAWRIALAQWQDLGDEESAARVARRLSDSLRP